MRSNMPEHLQEESKKLFFEAVEDPNVIDIDEYVMLHGSKELISYLEAAEKQYRIDKAQGITRG